jgi:hypothetical protein
MANFYAANVMDVDRVIDKIKYYYDEIKKLELYFFRHHDINIVLEEDAIDSIMEEMAGGQLDLETYSRQVSEKFELGLKLVRDKTGKNRFFLNRKALEEPESYISNLLQRELDHPETIEDPEE